MKLFNRLFTPPKDYKKVGGELDKKDSSSNECLDYVPRMNYYDASFQLTNDEFDEALSKAYDDLPKDFKDKLHNITIVAEEEAVEPFRSRLSPNMELLGLYVGVPLPKRLSSYGYGNMPDTIYIFKNPIRRTTLNKDHCLDQIRKTLWHEVGHYFGLDDVRLRELGY